jgi:hypothetical protein
MKQRQTAPVETEQKLTWGDSYAEGTAAATIRDSTTENIIRLGTVHK